MFVFFIFFVVFSRFRSSKLFDGCNWNFDTLIINSTSLTSLKPSHLLQHAKSFSIFLGHGQFSRSWLFLDKTARRSLWYWWFDDYFEFWLSFLTRCRFAIFLFTLWWLATAWGGRRWWPWLFIVRRAVGFTTLQFLYLLKCKHVPSSSLLNHWLCLYRFILFVIIVAHFYKYKFLFRNLEYNKKSIDFFVLT